MKTLLLGTILCLSLTDNYGQSNSAKGIVDVVEMFAKSADQQNVTKMKKVLHKDFRALVNRMFGSKDLSVTDKETYLSLLEAKKIGGDDRAVRINSISIQGANAYVHATFVGKKLIFNTYLLLVEQEDGTWQIVNDMPVIEKVES
ncbi:nuclear transport factor 2 family protein [Aureispira sp. CCB-E]|uniref:nuclear transport factor 2 family protein n=1 Tax=Aureispira sp. CCB-E TaxID=3051121 RepID=UPI0028697EDC|nr:nuclear transport factor 2 family protein [Aureispira sp. CCB-E]WMX14268.1 nuclear transport factor 2 family protein [Aureispira sp. CCB-E]